MGIRRIGYEVGDARLRQLGVRKGGRLGVRGPCPYLTLYLFRGHVIARPDGFQVTRRPTLRLAGPVNNFGEASGMSLELLKQKEYAHGIGFDLWA